MEINNEWQNVEISSPSGFVLEYNNNNCEYRYDRLAKIIYLISEEAMKNLEIDNGIAYVNGITQTPLMFNVYNMSLQDTDTLDERYQFSHQLTFSMHGYANYNDFSSRFYVIVKDLDDVFWLVNPLFPCKVAYTYTLDANSSHTDFTLSTISNFPMLRIYEKINADPYVCDGYDMTNFSSLMINNKKYSYRNENNNIVYTNSGFSDVVFSKRSQVFTETFDGTNLQHNIAFNIGFGDYKSSWHYNILEFADNIYSAIIKDSEGRWLTCGFDNGLQPSYTVTCTDSQEPNRIEIVLQDIHDSGNYVSMTNEGTIAYMNQTSYRFTKSHNGYECVGQNIARYLLKEEVDGLFNPTGNYQCLVGYEDRFPSLNIVGTFTQTETFETAQCSAQECKYYTSMPQTIGFNVAQCRTYTFKCDTDWSFTSNDARITVTPSNGSANTTYSVQVCNSFTPTSADTFESTLELSYCDTNATFNVVVVSPESCLAQGSTYNIGANGQNLTITTNCCVSSISDESNTVSNIQINNGSITMYVPQNLSGAERRLPMTILFCDGSITEIVVIQQIEYERWVKEGTTCLNGQKCDVERRYTGTSATDINTRTTTTRTTNCVTSDDCAEVMLRWVDSEETVCSNGNRYIIQYEQKSLDGGVSWSNTGNKRQGSQTTDPSEECSQEVTYEYQWVITQNTQCRNYNKYYLYKWQRRIVNEVDWEDVIPTVTSVDGDGTMPLVIAEEDSEDCGYTPPIEPQYKWVEVEGGDNYYCWWCDPTNVEEEWQFARYYCQPNASGGSDQYELQVLRASDDGETWYDVEPQRTRSILVERDSMSCLGSYKCIINRNYSIQIFNTQLIRCSAQFGDEQYRITSGDIMSHSDSIPSRYTTAMTIGNCASAITSYAFDGTHISGLTIPANITEIWASAFTYSRIVEMTFESETPPAFGRDVFEGQTTPIQHIYVPRSAVQAYKTAPNFEVYQSLIEGYD